MKRGLRLGSFLPIYLFVFGVCIGIAVFGSKAVTVMSQSAPLKDRHPIVIDAGHGGEDGGATSCTGILESTINLQIAQRLDDLLHFIGYDTVMIRNTDISVYTQGDTIAARKASDLRHRVKITNDTENGILISIHQNYFEQSKYHGAQVFYAADANSERLAKQLQDALVTSINKDSNRQAKKASGIYLMENIHLPGILVECGFLSNPEEEALLRNEEYQKKLCCVIASTVSNYLDRDDIN